MSDVMSKVFLKSAAGMGMRYAAEVRGPELADQPELRNAIMKAIFDAVLEYQPDETDWPYVKDQYLYDVYLEIREAEGTLTEHDLHRKGLSRANFSSEEGWYAHAARLTATNVKQAEKICSVCSVKQPASAFRAGSVCKKCAARRYRANLKARTK